MVLRSFTSNELPGDVLASTALEEQAYFLDTWDPLWAGMANFPPSELLDFYCSFFLIKYPPNYITNIFKAELFSPSVATPRSQ